MKYVVNLSYSFFMKKDIGDHIRNYHRCVQVKQSNKMSEKEELHIITKPPLEFLSIYLICK